LPDVKELYERLERKGLAVIGVSIDDTAEIAGKAAKQHDLGWRQVCDGKKRKGPLCAPFHVNGIPDCLIFGRAGKLRGRGERGIKLVELVEKLVKEPRPKRERR
jgi:hypothetical protein